MDMMNAIMFFVEIEVRYHDFMKQIERFNWWE
jgi:hypothetical protein